MACLMDSFSGGEGGSVAEEMGNMGTVRARKVRACYWVRKLKVDDSLEGLMNKWYISRTA